MEIFKEGVPNAAGAAKLRSLALARDRVLILTDASTSQIVSNALVPVTDRLRELPAQVLLTDVPKNKDERRAFCLLKKHLSRAWNQAYGTNLTGADLRALGSVLAVYKMDFSDGGPHQQTAETILASLADEPRDAAQLWRTLSVEAQRLADERSYLERDALVRRLENQGVNLRPVARLRADIARLRELTAANVGELASAMTIATPEGPVTLSRAIESTLFTAGGNLTVTGVPGAGKTVLLRSLAEASESSGVELVVLRADNLGSTTGQTRQELNTEHDVAEILRARPESNPPSC